MQYEIQKGETVYVLKLGAGDLQYLAHLIRNDNCTCHAWYCVDGDLKHLRDVRELAHLEGLEF